jgi:SlyX protein
LHENIRRLEEKIAYLERHVTEQDKAMLELGDELARLRRETAVLRVRLAPDATGDSPLTDDQAGDERPPHY